MSTYYTFSTIPQVLAATIALLGVFAIFKIQFIHNRLNGLSQNFYDRLIQEDRSKSSFITPNEIEKFRRIKISLNDRKSFQQMEHIMDLLKRLNYEGTWRFLEPIFLESQDLLKIKSNLIKHTVKAIGFSILIILICIIILPFAEKINNDWIWVLFLIIIPLFGLNLYQIFMTIKTAL